MRVPDYYVRLVDLPHAVYGVTMPNDDGTFSVYINARLSEKDRRETLEHEIEHMARGHFYSEASIAEQEAEANGRPLPKRPAPAAKTRTIPCYESLPALTEYLRSVGALGHSIESLGAVPLH